MAAMFVAGLSGSVRGITMSALLDQVVYRDAGTESYASMVSAGLLSSSGGLSRRRSPHRHIGVAPNR